VASRVTLVMRLSLSNRPTKSLSGGLGVWHSLLVPTLRGRTDRVPPCSGIVLRRTGAVPSSEGPPPVVKTGASRRKVASVRNNRASFQELNSDAETGVRCRSMDPVGQSFGMSSRWYTAVKSMAALSRPSRHAWKSIGAIAEHGQIVRNRLRHHATSPPPAHRAAMLRLRSS